MKTTVPSHILRGLAMALGLSAFVPAAIAQSTVDLINLTFSPTNAGDIAAHPDVSNITAWTNGSVTSPDPFGSGLYVPPDDDIGNGYAGLTAPATRFGFQWGFEGSFDLNSAFSWDVMTISFDYDVLGHNGEADLALSLGGWSGNAPLPSTDGPPNNGPYFTPVAVAERATGSVTFDFVNDTLTVTRTGYASYSTAFADSLTLSNGTQGIDILVSNTNPFVGDGYWDVNAGSAGGSDAFYRIDNFRVTGVSPVPEPSAALLGGFALLGFLTRRRR